MKGIVTWILKSESSLNSYMFNDIHKLLDMKKLYCFILFFSVLFLVGCTNIQSLKLESSNLLKNQKVLSDSIQTLLQQISVLSDSLHKQIKVNNSIKSNVPENSSLKAKTNVKNDKKYVVYQGVGKKMRKVGYIGITSQTPSKRFGVHLKAYGTGRDTLIYSVIPGYTDLTEMQAKVIEQTLINKYRKENPDVFLNKNNPIAKKYWRMNNIK